MASGGAEGKHGVEKFSSTHPSSPPTFLLLPPTDSKSQNAQGEPKSCFNFSACCRFSGLHQGLPPGERDLRGQEEDQVGQEVPGPSLQPGLGLL